MYLNRTIETTINEYSTQFQALVIYGARQVGKSSTVYNMFVNSSRHFNYVSLDDSDDRILANTNPKLFLQNYSWPLVIDEIQKAPALLEEIKIAIDKQRSTWMANDEDRELMYVLTGSNRFELAAGVSESLAGRCGIVEMYSFSNLECQKIHNFKFDINLEYFNNVQDSAIATKTQPQIFEQIFNGGMPDVITKKTSRDPYFSSYVNTYIERDVLALVKASNEALFRNFLQVLALRTGQVLKISEVANIVGIEVKTAKRWLSILQTSGIVFLLQPYLPNATKRIIKAPKIYFMDTGLCSYLCGLQDSNMASKGIMAGPIFETYIASEIIKNLTAQGVDVNRFLFYYRDFDQREIDLLYVSDGQITPIEIKKGVAPNKPNKNFHILEKYGLLVKTGFVIENCDKIRPINENVYAIPAYLI